jgi:hypothetical protein
LTWINLDGRSCARGSSFLIFVIGPVGTMLCCLRRSDIDQTEPSRATLCYQFIIYANRMTSSFDMPQFYGVESGSRPMTQA